jgi:hypothetical protein
LFDTVRFAIDLPNTPPGLMRGGWDRVTSESFDASGYRLERTKFVRAKEGDLPAFIQYVPGEGLKFEASLPRLVHGSNVQLLAPADVAPALDALADRVTELVGVALPDPEDWSIAGRADAVYSWDTTGAATIADYMQAFKPREIPRHYSQAVDRDSTLYWRNKSRVSRLYDKGEESGLPEARGLLRFEVQSRRFKAELRALGLHGEKDLSPVRAGKVLNWSTARAVLARQLLALGADLVVTNEAALIARLLEAVRPSTGKQLRPGTVARMLGVIHLLKEFGFDGLEDRGFARRTLFRWRSELAEFAVPIGAVRDGLVLPSLLLPGAGEYSGASQKLAA